MGPGLGGQCAPASVTLQGGAIHHVHPVPRPAVLRGEVSALPPPPSLIPGAAWAPAPPSHLLVPPVSLQASLLGRCGGHRAGPGT